MRITTIRTVMVAWFAAAASLACDKTEEDGDGGTDARRDGGDAGEVGGDGGDAVPEAGDATTPPTYSILAIYDKEAMDCTGTGPGPDIDAIELRDGTTLVGVGRIGSALHTGGASPCSTCAAGPCKYSGAALAKNIEGVRDARVFAAMTDTGYISLNSDFVAVEIGDATGAGPKKEIRPGQTVRIWEVDQVYRADMSAFAGCVCKPERYEVWAFKTLSDIMSRVKLVPSKYEADNSVTCGLTPSTDQGCGTSTFTVP